MTKYHENKIQDNKLELLKFWSVDKEMLNRLWQEEAEEKTPVL